MSITQYNDPILPVWYTDGEGNKISIEITNDYYKVVKDKIMLEGIPSEYVKINNITVNGSTIYEARKGTRINTNNFTVDYNLGIITVDSSYDGKTALVSSWSNRGAIFFPASRVYDVVNGCIANGEFLGKTLQDYINEIAKYVFKDEFSSFTTYYQNNIVYYLGSTYICYNDNNGIGITDINPYNTTYWRLIATGFQYRGTYNSSSTYYSRDIVVLNNSTYLCIATSTGNHPTNTSYWQIFSAGLNFREDYNNTSQYYPRDVVTYAGSTYVCKVASIGETPYSSGKWAVFAQKGENFFYFDSAIEIMHNLNTYNIQALVVVEQTFGHGGYGNFAMGNNFQLDSIIEYLSLNSIRLHLADSFQGTPTITTIIAGESYTVSFSDEDTLIYVYLK
jgi:hypothetical protein